jgi:hypothetical protein
VLDWTARASWTWTGCASSSSKNDYARTNRHNRAVVRAINAINRLLKLTEIKELLVLVDDPVDLMPPPLAH